MTQLHNLTTGASTIPIRGVNIGGWLVLERYITPSVFALTKCHLQGNLCWYPDTIATPSKQKDINFWSSVFHPSDEMMPSTREKELQKKEITGVPTHPSYQLCPQECTQNPVLVDNIFNATDYAVDEWNLAQIWRNYSTLDTAEAYMNVHFDKFVTFQDLQRVKQAGMTHVRVPLPHWILQNHASASEFQDLYGALAETEPYIAGARWKYFVRLCHWARTLQLQVWPNIHTAPGSQNAFDNSGHQGTSKTCDGWMEPNQTMVSYNGKLYPSNVARSLQVIDHITKQMSHDNVTDVVTGFGLLNEPYTNCNLTIYKQFLDDGLELVRARLSPQTGVFVSDLFWAPQFNDGEWWLNATRYHDTYLDSHYYNVFTDAERHMSPSNKLEHVCDAPVGKGLQVGDCCWERPSKSNTTHPSEGVQRIVTEFSAAYDSMPGELLKIILQSFQEHGRAPAKNRTISKDRAHFLNLYIKAQLISMERSGGQGWFFWSLKMESDYFEEWDFFRGLDHGWFPDFTGSGGADDSTANDFGATNTLTSKELFGSCDSLIDQASQLNVSKVVHVYPWGDSASYNYWDPQGYGWKFDHEQETKKNASEGDANSSPVIENVTTMLKHTSKTGNSAQAPTAFERISGNADTTQSNNKAVSYHPRVSKSLWIIVQVAVVVLLLVLAFHKVRNSLGGRSNRRRWQYSPIKDSVTDESESGSSDNENNVSNKYYGAVASTNV
jgi:glucan 1,3-beta-glucosidase